MCRFLARVEDEKGSIPILQPEKPQSVLFMGDSTMRNQFSGLCFAMGATRSLNCRQTMLTKIEKATICLCTGQLGGATLQLAFVDAVAISEQHTARRYEALQKFVSDLHVDSKRQGHREVPVPEQREGQWMEQEGVRINV